MSRVIDVGKKTVYTNLDILALLHLHTKHLESSLE